MTTGETTGKEELHRGDTIFAGSGGQALADAGWDKTGWREMKMFERTKGTLAYLQQMRG